MNKLKETRELESKFDALTDNDNLQTFDANNLSESEIMAGRSADITINIICRPKKDKELSQQ